MALNLGLIGFLLFLHEESFPLRLHSDELHFSSKKQPSTFKVPITIGPFIVKNRAAIELIDDIMACFGFALDFSCQYDPFHII